MLCLIEERFMQKYKVKGLIENYSFIVPALVMYCVFNIYPFVRVFQLSLFDWDGISPQGVFVGFRNFVDIFLYDSTWWQAMWQVVYITVLALTLQNFLALMLALAVAREIRCGNIYGVIFYLPPVLSGIVVGLIWNWIYDGDYGLLNYFLSSLGLDKLCRAWLADPKTALTSIAFIHMWKGFGWGFIILLAGLQGIPEELYEAARVDGANSWHRFWNITVPFMLPVFFLVSILTIIGTMQIFDIIASTTRGGPGYNTEVPITRILFSMQRTSRYGYACAQGVVFGVFLLMASLMQLRVSRKMQK